MGEHVLTADDLRTVTFDKPPCRLRGYNENQVGARLDEIASAIDHLDG
ncbi:MAG: DivIVA domain-containing protein [Mycobacterium kyogaense]